MQNWRKILLPFSPLYGLAIRVRNFLFDKGLMKSSSYNVPIIAIGNLTTGGTGKTPHIEYLIRLLRKSFKVATISRGYGRSTKGYIHAKGNCTTKEIGDEPMQYFTKFPDISVNVAEERKVAIESLIHSIHKPQVILMDDAYQHRAVTPGLNILLLEYEYIFKTDNLLPAGNLREPMSSKKRADVIIVSKSPSILVPIEKKRILEVIQPTEEQQVYFSYLKYGEFNKVFGQQSPMLMGASYYMEKRFTILMVTGIANPSGLIEYLRRHTDKLETLIFPDHHEFTSKDLDKITDTFNNIANQSKIIVTTEKDAMRLRDPELDPSIQKLPLFFLPIEVYIHQDEEKFNKMITNYVRQN
ncbi:MAG TPA: tetraacyldisaccharide 4'-kinase [Bacteroidia bacterium]|nr:tetraacyldisaccharide 4'-kinase [Bacteroidia bacterium]